jgi:hypothetical protein
MPVAVEAFTNFAGFQGSIRQDVWLIYLAHAHLTLRAHTKTV